MTLKEARLSLTPANYIQIGLLIFAAGGGWVITTQQGQKSMEAITSLTLEVREAQAARTALDIRIRALETKAAVSDVQYGNIMALLTRMDARLEKMEGKR